jgi:hypothetical protein
LSDLDLDQRTTRAVASPFMALALLGLACGRDDLPSDQLLTSPHFRYHARADAVLDPTIMDRLEKHRSEFDAEFGIDSGVVDYYLFRDSDDLAAHSGCPGRDCAPGRTVLTSYPFQEHELVHALLGDLGPVPPVLGEGIAQHAACLQPQIAALVDFGTWPQVVGTDPGTSDLMADRRVYDFGERLAAWMLEQGGPRRFAEFYGASLASLDPALFTLEFERTWGQRLSDVAGELDADRYGGSSCACTAPEVPADGSPTSFVASQDYRTFDAPEESEVDLMSDGGAITYPASCTSAADEPVGSLPMRPVATLTVARVGAGRYDVTTIGAAGTTVTVRRRQKPASDWGCAAALAAPVDVGAGDVAFWVTPDLASGDTWFAAKIADDRVLAALTEEGKIAVCTACDACEGVIAGPDGQVYDTPSKIPVPAPANGVVLIHFLPIGNGLFGIHSVGAVLRAPP